jgi:hypothetical protein
MLDFRRLGRGTKPNIIYGALPNLPKTELSVQALDKRSGKVFNNRRFLIWILMAISHRCTK